MYRLNFTFHKDDSYEEIAQNIVNKLKPVNFDKDFILCELKEIDRLEKQAVVNQLDELKLLKGLLHDIINFKNNPHGAQSRVCVLDPRDLLRIEPDAIKTS